MDSGEPFVMTSSIKRMPMWLANSWDFQGLSLTEQVPVEGIQQRMHFFVTSNASNSMYCECRFNSGSGPIWLDDLQCTVSDTRLISCTHRAVGTHSCGHSEDIAVYCNSK